MCAAAPQVQEERKDMGWILLLNLQALECARHFGRESRDAFFAPLLHKADGGTPWSAVSLCAAQIGALLGLLRLLCDLARWCADVA